MRGQRIRASVDRGFTLVELLIVITILGIIAAIVVFAVGGVADKGTKSVCRTNLKSIVAAEEAYFAAHGSFTDIPSLVSDGLIREAPPTTEYVISVDTATGDVTADHNDCKSL